MYFLEIKIPGDESGRVLESPPFESIAESVEAFREGIDQLEERGWVKPGWLDPETRDIEKIDFTPVAEEDGVERGLTATEFAAMNAAFEQRAPHVKFDDGTTRH